MLDARYRFVSLVKVIMLLRNFLRRKLRVKPNPLHSFFMTRMRPERAASRTGFSTTFPQKRAALIPMFPSAKKFRAPALRAEMTAARSAIWGHVLHPARIATMLGCSLWTPNSGLRLEQ